MAIAVGIDSVISIFSKHSAESFSSRKSLALQCRPPPASEIVEWQVCSSSRSYTAATSTYNEVYYTVPRQHSR
jgi:hypothetical protein